ncbi:Substrate binding protein of an ABC transporter complex [Leptospira biflexa serovar Patoc strain 'Patoc 1 (Ames)']|uniref:ABC-type transport system, periplasmic component n=1 Tax=Leptospira biflexa serovar Patoc (strain Patoc 1 / ATCC 23582 / Paris) TaxID=456481 RepID=B0SLS3_LEPBP|nr:ABC transporter substrate-binding protein [Leptospira biflexa]ABZ93350.1 Substrate binding protein of an ABC transporter complex [Leptospira biflexa serovar Patoc strain 'Patoc 1 (Ames)']ABZ96975.1 ABC-type transport system, periplasmic component [Leptospira biflexa serovar Patoc strain 'Patoc 1 (Paris)']
MRTLSLVFFLLSLTFCRRDSVEFDIKIALPSDPTNLDPLFSTDLTSQKLARFLHQGLFISEKGFFISPWITKETKVQSASESILRFTLNSDSPPIQDIQFSLSRLILESYPRKADYQFLKSVEILSGSVLELHIRKDTSESEWKEKLSLPFASIIGKEEWAKNTLKTYGKYKLVNWKKNEFIDIHYQKDNGIQFPKSIRFYILPQSTTSLFLYRKSELDAFKLSDFLLSIPEATSIYALTKKGRSVQYVTINQTNPCFDFHFRNALNFSIPRELIIQKLLENHADLTYGPIPLPYLETLKLKLTNIDISYNREKALIELKQSRCYPNILTKQIEFRMRGDDENQTKGRAIKQALEEIGLKIKLKPMEKAPLYKENGEGKGDLTLLTWYSDYDSVWNFLDPLFHPDKTGNGGNRSFYQNPKLGLIFNKPNRNLTDAIKVIETVTLDKPWIFLWSIQENYLVSKEFLRYTELADYL